MKHDPNAVMRNKCATCPFREGSTYAHLAEYLKTSAITDGNRICHSTGTSAIKGKTGKPERVCRGARDEQILFFYRLGVLSEPTDDCWADTLKEIERRRLRLPRSRAARTSRAP